MIVNTTREHRDAILDIAKRMPNFSDEDAAIVAELIDIYLNPPETGEYEFLSYVQDGQVVGFACYGRKPMCIRVTELYWIGVDPRLHRSGIGKKLIAEVEARAQAMGSRMLVLETEGRESYADTRKFYDARGYAPVANIPDLFADGSALIIYRKRWDKPENGRVTLPE